MTAGLRERRLFSEIGEISNPPTRVFELAYCIVLQVEEATQLLTAERWQEAVAACEAGLVRRFVVKIVFPRVQ